ncbi:MAG: GyrI-like domain-containing protein [Acidobacteriota bacterium]
MSSSEKLDLLKLHRAEYRATSRPVLVEVENGSFIRVRGHGAPGSELFQQRVEALYAVAYTLKFNSKFAGRDYGVSKLEGLFGVDGQSIDEIAEIDPSEWNWRLVIRVPEFTTQEHLEQARATLRDKGKTGDFDAVSLESFHEGTCVQMLHVGPYDREAATLEEMRNFARTRDLTPHLWHHEIYLSDPRRVPPERLRTILRLPLLIASPE